MVDKDARVNIKKIQMSASAMKFYCGCNHFGEIDNIIKNGVLSDEFPRCIEKEMWEHVVQYINAASTKAEFILELNKDLKKVQVE